MSDDSVHVEYNRSLRALEELLEVVDRPGNFFVNGSLEIPMPKVEVDGVGTLSFPVPEAQVQQLIQRATRAPYGRGEQTILDESVRKVWQLPQDRVRISGKSWDATFGDMLKQVIAGLGCEGVAVQAELYKLLVYDTGGFFLSHRDTEKAKGMFGTLVIVLPSAHRGGELVLRHAGREATVDMSNGGVSEVNFAAFYADCEHEVRPITEGSRVCLVFNLIQQRDLKSKGGSLRAPDHEMQIAASAELLAQNLATHGAPAKVAWLLEHQYSPDGLSFAGLKAADAARAQVLAHAAPRAGCVAHLGIVHIEESGSAHPIYNDYRPRRWRRYDDYDDETIETESNDSDKFEVIEVCDSRHYIAQWRDLQDQSMDFGEIPLEPGELLPAEALDDEKPDEQRLMEASGNEGASFERSYHRAAVVIWRRDHQDQVLLQAGVAAIMPHFKQKVDFCLAKGAPSEARNETLALARKIFEEWKKPPERHWHAPARPEKRDGMLGLLLRLGDTALLANFIEHVVTRDYDGSDNAALADCAPALGPKQTGKLYTELVRRHAQHLLANCVDLLHALTRAQQTSGNSEWQNALRQIAAAIVSKIPEVGESERHDSWMDWRATTKTSPVNARVPSTLLDTLANLDASELGIAAANAFASRPAVFDPVTIVVPALVSLRVWNDAAKRLWEHSAGFLLQRSARSPEDPKDWRQMVTLSCSCADCRELQKFATDPQAQVARFRIRQDRRQHLHQMIEQHNLDMAHVTERKGSPQTLVCTKDRRSYLRLCDQYRKDVAALMSLLKLASKLGAKGACPADLLKSIESARALADQWSPSSNV